MDVSLGEQGSESLPWNIVSGPNFVFIKLTHTNNMMWQQLQRNEKFLNNISLFTRGEDIIYR